MALIQVDSRQLREAATQLTSLKNEFGINLNDISRHMAVVDQYWDGPASEEFKARYNALGDNFQDYQIVLDEYKRFLEEAATAYETTEEANKTDVSRLNESTIFDR
ncbi:MAG: WXG100 family type VII secretion target [Clostridiales bacterium]|jgi:WXG100 family type VII secretion target|nr:WXG100 family type VII secretion target [Clostridiales bacterium]